VTALGPIEAYVAALAEALHVGRRQRRRILDEVEGHLEEAAAYERAHGAAAPEAERKAVARFGSVRVIAREFDAVFADRARGRAWLTVGVPLTLGMAALAVLWPHPVAPPPAIARVQPAEPPANVEIQAPQVAVAPKPPTPAPAPHIMACKQRVTHRSAAKRMATEVLQAPPVEQPAPEQAAPELVAKPSPPVAPIAVAASSRGAPPEPLYATHRLLVRYAPPARWIQPAGDVFLILQVDRDGRVEHATVTKHLGYGVDELCAGIAERFRFRAARDAQGRSTESFVTWKLHVASADRPQATMLPPGLLSAAPEPAHTHIPAGVVRTRG
jgi:hypothetical protein